MAVVAPMPRAGAMIPVSAKPGAFRNWRSASRRSASMRSSEGRWWCVSDVGIRKLCGGGSIGSSSSGAAITGRKICGLKVGGNPAKSCPISATSLPVAIGTLSPVLSVDRVQAENQKNRCSKESFSQRSLYACSLQRQTRGQSHDDVGKILWFAWRGSIKLGKQPGNQSSHGVDVSAVQLSIGLCERFVAAGLQLKLCRE